jgi:pyruvate formate lyase activating enzyme
MFRFLEPIIAEEVACTLCGKTSSLISKALGVCGDCTKKEEALSIAKRAHALSKKRFGLPPEPPQNPKGTRCGLCVNDCRIPEGGKGYCGLRINREGKLVHLAGTPGKGVVEWYYDPLPTNCVAEWCCPGGTGAGYPRYSYSKEGPEYGYKNLAVFYGACSFDCLFCQNWHYRNQTKNLSPVMSAEELAGKVDENTSCICYFGGDPSPQMPHAIRTSDLAIQRAEGRVLRICFESNGTMARGMLRKAARLSLESGGCIKFDLKAWSENLNIALTGVTNRRTLKNFKWLAEYGKERRVPPFLIASTLLVPGYVDAREVEGIARFIAELDPEIPYSLLAFHPHYYMADMPTTSRRHAEECYNVARKYLKNVRIGNIHLLS